ncbi:MAG TPA: S41 family peptidase [Clostridiales bacterium]|nr:S41 family peptidase [Clostridiales bacterium]
MRSRIKRKKLLTVEEKLKRYKRRFFVLLSILILFISLTGIYIYLNYDYLVFKHFISQNYIYTKTLDKLYNDELKRDVKSRYFSYFDNVVISVVTKKIQEINSDRYTYLYIPEQYKKYKEEEREEALLSELKILDNNTAYLHITNFSNYTRKFLEGNIEMIKKYPGLIIDLRSNYGGDTLAMYAMTDLFLPKGSIISTDKMRLFSKTYKAKKNKILSNKNIIILQDKNTASASENFIAGLRDNLENVLLIGDKTFGKGIGQFTMPLKRGFAVKATTMLWYTPNGINIQGEGISPDIYYSQDDIIDFALRKINQLD